MRIASASSSTIRTRRIAQTLNGLELRARGVPKMRRSAGEVAAPHERPRTALMITWSTVPYPTRGTIAPSNATPPTHPAHHAKDISATVRQSHERAAQANARAAATPLIAAASETPQV